MQLQTSMQIILVNIYRIGLLRLSAGAYAATASTAAAVVWNGLDALPLDLVMFGKRFFLPRLRGKRTAIILQFLGRRLEENQNWCKKF